MHGVLAHPSRGFSPPFTEQEPTPYNEGSTRIPYDLIGETVDVRLTRDIVEVFYRGSRVAAHALIFSISSDPSFILIYLFQGHKLSGFSLAQNTLFMYIV